MLGSKNSHCENKSIGSFVIGDPVNILLYFASVPSFKIFFVCCACGFFIVVDSSTHIKALCPFKNRSANRAPLIVRSASTFINKISMVKSFGSLIIDSNKLLSSLLGVGVQATVKSSMCSGKCVGISWRCQLRYTPFGAIIKAPLIWPWSYSIAILSSKTFDLPVPISINKP